MPKGFFVFAVTSVFLMSSLGTLCNSFLLLKSVTRTSTPNGFQKICTVKTISNMLICSAFLFWVVPVVLLSLTYSQLNYIANRTVGTVAPAWAYLLNSHLAVCLACNRFYALFFPFGIKIWRTVPMTSISIGISLAVATVFSVITVPVGCGYVFDPNLFVWRGEIDACSEKISVIFPYLIFGTTIVTNSFNVATGARLLVSKMTGLSKESADRRRKRWMLMFTQSVIQDCLQLVDTVNSYYIVNLSSQPWFQFLFVTLSFVTVTALDGFAKNRTATSLKWEMSFSRLVMFICHSDCHPGWMKRRMAKPNVSSNQVQSVTS